MSDDATDDGSPTGNPGGEVGDPATDGDPDALAMDGDPDAQATDGDPGTYAVEFVEEGHTVECAPDEYVLDAALDAGIEVPYGCLMGVCTICSGRVEGEVDQTEGAALTEDEIRRGYALTCIAYPRSDLRVWTSEGP